MRSGCDTVIRIEARSHSTTAAGPGIRMPCNAHGNVDTDVFDVALAVDVPLPASGREERPDLHSALGWC
jgi:hypothetical protein